MRMIPLEKIADPYVRNARESYWIEKFGALKKLSVTEIEHGLNISRGQTV